MHAELRLGHDHRFVQSTPVIARDAPHRLAQKHDQGHISRPPPRTVEEPDDRLVQQIAPIHRVQSDHAEPRQLIQATQLTIGESPQGRRALLRGATSRLARVISPACRLSSPTYAHDSPVFGHRQKKSCAAPSVSAKPVLASIRGHNPMLPTERRSQPR